MTMPKYNGTVWRTDDPGQELITEKGFGLATLRLFHRLLAMFNVIVYSLITGTLLLLASHIYSDELGSGAHMLLAGGLAAVGILLLVDIIHLQLRWSAYELNPGLISRDFYLEAGKFKPRREPLLVKYSPIKFLSHVLHLQELGQRLTDLIIAGLYGKARKAKDEEDGDKKQTAIEVLYGFNSKLP
jgi:hypothetical protein